MKTRHETGDTRYENRTGFLPVSCLLSRVWLLIAICVLSVSAVQSAAQTTQPATRFAAVDVFVDPLGQPLGAYQIEFKSTKGDVKLVGVEGGASEAFKKPPYYDPKALQQSRIIVAAFSTDSSLPTTKTRVARLHVQISGPDAPEYDLKLIIAGDAKAKPIEAKATFAPYEDESATETHRHREKDKK